MFELKKHVKERLIKRTEGIISLLLIVLLVPFYSVAAILEEVGRYQSALRGLDSAISSSEMSVLAQYDQFLMDRFALLAIDQNKNIDQQFLSYLKSRIHRIRVRFLFQMRRPRPRAYTHWQISRYCTSRSMNFQRIPFLQSLFWKV